MSEIDFRGGLLPAIVRDVRTGAVLMLAWMNEESFARTVDERQTWFWSRSRQELWHKGATSGNVQKVVNVRTDCDGDAILIDVVPQGPACHTGERSCFGDGPGVGQASSLSPLYLSARLDPSETRVPARAAGVSLTRGDRLEACPTPGTHDGLDLRRLFELLVQRKSELPEGSYTAELFRDGVARMNEKVIEEAEEVTVAATRETHQRLVEESADLIFHLMVLLVEKSVGLGEIAEELERRVGKRRSG